MNFETRHTCDKAHLRGLSAAQATDTCARCQFLLHASLAPTTAEQAEQAEQEVAR